MSLTPLRDRKRRRPCTVKKISGHQHTIPIDRGFCATDVHRLVIQRQEFGISRHVASRSGTPARLGIFPETAAMPVGIEACASLHHRSRELSAPLWPQGLQTKRGSRSDNPSGQRSPLIANGANREPIEALETKIHRKPYVSILLPLDFDWQAEIDQSCLEERQREHVARMHMERGVERICRRPP